MLCTVASTAAALDQLASIWLTAPNPSAVQAASDAIDIILKYHADQVGSDLGAHKRLRVDPLEVDFTYSANDCFVRIIPSGSLVEAYFRP